MVSIFFISAIVLLIIGIPISVTLGAASLLYIFSTGIEPMIIVQRMFTGINSTALLAIPFFIMAGDLMNSGGIARRLVNLLNSLVGRFPGGLAIVTILSCMFFAAISGSGVATAAAMGAIMIPEMVKSGYDKVFSSSLVAASSTIGIIIPPSLSFILYGVATQSSIADLYLAGIPAGIWMGLSLIIVAYVISKKKGYKGSEEKVTAKYILDSFVDSLWALGAPVILIGGVFGGIFTPTESAVVAVVYAIIVGLFFYKDLKFKDIYRILLGSAKTTANIMFIIANATVFAYVLSYERIPQMIVEGFGNISSSPIIIMALINLMLLIAGTFMESSAIIIILVPLLWPVAQQLGIDVVHFGIIVTVNAAIGLVTPPFGVCLFTTSSISRVSVESLSKNVLIFLGAMIAVLFLITYVPQTVMFLLN